MSLILIKSYQFNPLSDPSVKLVKIDITGLVKIPNLVHFCRCHLNSFLLKSCFESCQAGNKRKITTHIFNKASFLV